MKSTTLLITSLLATAAIASPHEGHLAKHQHKGKRNQAVEWVTTWVTDYETVGYTSTIWVSPGFIAPTTSKTPTTSTTSTSSTTSNSPAQFFQGASTATTSTTSKSSTSVYVAPVPSSTSVSVAPAASTTSVYVAPVIETPTSSSTPVVVAETVAPVVYSAPAVVATTSTSPEAVVSTTSATAEVAIPTTSSSSSSSSGSSDCSESNPCAGDMTHYTAGVGACGWPNNGTTDAVVALAHEYMGTQSNGNPFCGRNMTVKCTATGKTTTAMVVDKCMGCFGYSIDLSDKAYADLDDEGVGREGATWWWID